MTEPSTDSERRALEVLEAYMATFNAHDWQRNAETLNYPHIRIAGPRVTVWDSADEYARDNPNRIRRTFESGWHHSGFDRREIIQSSADKVHVLVQFSRYDEQGRRLASYPTLWIVTCLDGHWGIQARSTFAG